MLEARCFTLAKVVCAELSQKEEKGASWKFLGYSGTSSGFHSGRSGLGACLGGRLGGRTERPSVCWATGSGPQE